MGRSGSTKEIELKLEKMHRRIVKQYDGVELNSGVRWEEGCDHHPKSKELMEHIMALDFEFQDDYFCWKEGGDGDNGEALMYLMDMYFEMKDKNENSSSNKKSG